MSLVAYILVYHSHVIIVSMTTSKQIKILVANASKPQSENRQPITDYYEQVYTNLGGSRDRIAEKFGVKKGEVLDIGCGDGFFTIALAKQLKNGYVLGIDFIPEWIMRAKKEIKEANVVGKASVKVLDFWKNTFPDDHFDQIATFLTLSNIANNSEDLERFFKEVYRILKPGGTLLLVEATSEDAESDAEKTGFVVNQDLSYHYYSKQQIGDAMKHSGLVPKEIGFSVTGTPVLSFEEFTQFVEQEGEILMTDRLGDPSVVKSIIEKNKDAVEKHGIHIDAKMTIIVVQKPRF